MFITRSLAKLIGRGRGHTYGGDHLADAVRVDQADIEHEGHQVEVENVRLQSQVRGDQGPADEERQKADESLVGGFATLAASGHDVEGAVRIVSVPDSQYSFVPILTSPRY